MNNFKRLPNSPISDQVNVAEALLALCRIRVRNAATYIPSECERIQRTYWKKGSKLRAKLIKLTALGLS